MFPYTYCFENFSYFSNIWTVRSKNIFLLHEKLKKVENYTTHPIYTHHTIKKLEVVTFIRLVCEIGSWEYSSLNLKTVLEKWTDSNVILLKTSLNLWTIVKLKDDLRQHESPIQVQFQKIKYIWGTVFYLTYCTYFHFGYKCWQFRVVVYKFLCVINISLTSSNNQFSEFRILNIYNEILFTCLINSRTRHSAIYILKSRNLF